MTELSFEEQDLIIDKLINKYFGRYDTGIEYYGFIPTNKGRIEIVWLYESNFSSMQRPATIELVVNGFVLEEYTTQELQRKYFQDILTPTQNELIMFELTEGFEWPLQSKFLKKE